VANHVVPLAVGCEKERSEKIFYHFMTACKTPAALNSHRRSAVSQAPFESGAKKAAVSSLSAVVGGPGLTRGKNRAADDCKVWFLRLFPAGILGADAAPFTFLDVHGFHHPERAARDRRTNLRHFETPLTRSIITAGRWLSRTCTRCPSTSRCPLPNECASI
jgi:hypothetical protein